MNSADLLNTSNIPHHLSLDNLSLQPDTGLPMDGIGVFSTDQPIQDQSVVNVFHHQTPSMGQGTGTTVSNKHPRSQNTTPSHRPDKWCCLTGGDESNQGLQRMNIQFTNLAELILQCRGWN